MSNSIELRRMQKREGDTRNAFHTYEQKRVIAVATLRNLARNAEERAGLLPPGCADRAAMQDYADELWRAYTHAQQAGNTPVLFAATTHGTSAA